MATPHRSLLGAPEATWRSYTRPYGLPPMTLGQAAELPTPVPGDGGALAPAAPPRTFGLTRGQLLLVVIVLVILLAAAYQLGRRLAPTPMESIRKASTSRLSRELYGRLERNGGGSTNTRAALAQLGREA